MRVFVGLCVCGAVCLSAAAFGRAAADVRTTQTLVVKDGKVAGDGWTVEFIGACDLGAVRPRPWGLDGKPLSAAKAALFWRAIDQKPEYKELHSPYGPGREARWLAIGLVVRGPVFVFGAAKDVGKDYVALDGFGSGVLGDTPRLTRFVLQPRRFDHGFALRLVVQPAGGKEILSFDEGTTHFPPGFDFEFEPGPPIVIINPGGNRAAETSIPVLRTVATIPAALQGLKLDLLVDQGESRSSAVPLSAVRSAVRGEQVGRKYAGKLLFTFPVPDESKGKRHFTLRAKTTELIEFRNIPLHPAK